MRTSTLAFILSAAVVAAAGSLPRTNINHQLRMHKQVIRRQTPEQITAFNALKVQDDEFHKKNSIWQAAVLQDLKDGKTPLNFDEFWAQKGDSRTGASDPNPADGGNDDEDDDDDDDDDYEDDGEDDGDDDDDDEDDYDGGETTVPSSSYVDSHTSSLHIAHATKTKTAAPAATSTTSPGAGSGSGGAEHTGQGTYYNMAGGYTACGQKYTDDDMVAALSWSLYDTKTIGGNPNNNGFCGKKIKATYQGKSVIVTAVDRCEGCAEWDLDFTPAAFKKLADMSIGRISGVEWQFV